MKDYNKLLLVGLLSIFFIVYSLYLYCENTDFSMQLGSSSDRGKRLWQENNCTACHQVYGLGGHLGPDLTNTYSERGIKLHKSVSESRNRGNA